MLLGPLDHTGERLLDPREDERAGLAHLEGERRVDHVRGGQAVVEPAAVLAEVRGDRVHERRQIVSRPLLQRGHRLGCRRPGALPDRVDGLARDDSDLAPAHERRDLHLEPVGKPALVRPDPRHGRPGVAANHRTDGNARNGRQPPRSLSG
jgi:hypothetical protein